VYDVFAVSGFDQNPTGYAAYTAAVTTTGSNGITKTVYDAFAASGFDQTPSGYAEYTAAVAVTGSSSITKAQYDAFAASGFAQTPSGYAEYTSSWKLVGSDIDGEASFDNSGRSVSLNQVGNVVAVGASGNDGNGVNSGHVRVYILDGTNWIQMGSDIDGEAMDDGSGYSVSLNNTGTTVAIGATGNDGNGADSGHARVYSWNGSNWFKLGQDLDGEAAGDMSGHSVSLNGGGDVVAVGAILNDGNISNSGHVRVYVWNGTTWAQRGADIDGSTYGAVSGYSVSLNDSGTILAEGGIYYPNGNPNGQVRVHQWNGTNWIRLGQDINGDAGSNTGFSISLSDDGYVVAVGANYANGVAGRTRVYSLNGDSWVQRGSDIVGESGGDQSGHSVSLNGAGNVVAVGAIWNGGSGDVRVFAWNGVNWIQRGLDIVGEAGGDQYGYSICLNGAGTTLAVGAIGNDGSGQDSGHARVYSFS
jgi:hypothetical protein